MAEKVVDYEKLLKELSLRVGEEDATQIRVLLEQVRVDLTCWLNWNNRFFRMSPRRLMMRHLT